MNFSTIHTAAAAPEFRQQLVDLLMALCRHNTAIRSDVAGLRDAERQVFDILEQRFTALGFDASHSQRLPVDPAIAKHPFFSQLYYTCDEAHPNGRTVEDCYQGRANLLLMIDGEQRSGAGTNYAVNAHIDVVQPYIPPRIEGDIVFGRGACDDKGNVVAVMGALQLVRQYLRQHKLRLNRNLTAMMVIEEEMGGNGSLSLAIDRNLKKRYDALTVMEICESRIFPGNRGCVWYKVEASLPGVNLFECSAFIIEELEHNGRALRAESDHPLFPHRPVQTCHGIMNDNGQHPSRINGNFPFDIVFDSPRAAADARSLILDVLRFALDEYCGVYGDKTKVLDKTSGKPKVDHHYDIAATDFGYTVTVFGSTGHMGSIFENDGAITKAATMVRSLIRSREALASRSGAKGVSFRQTGWKDPSVLLLEGGQGFLPTHDMAQVQRRGREAVQRGAEYYLRLMGKSADVTRVFKVSYDKLHNAAFAGRADSEDMQRAIVAAKATGIWDDKPIRGWDVSCDSRIFACEYPDMNVITTGPGSLAYAHGDHEQISITEMVKFAEFLACYMLLQTGTVTA